MSNEALIAAFELYHDDPVAFAREMFGVELTSQQEEIARSIAQNRRVSVRSGHGVGKTFLMAVLAWWFMCTRHKAIVVATAPTAHQLYDNLFKELINLKRKLPKVLQDEFDHSKDRIWHRRHKEEWYLVARTGTKDNPDALQGFHNQALLILADEASGIADEVFAPVEGIMTGPDNRMIMAGNPTRTTGYFYDSQHKRRRRWHCLRMACHDSPMVSREYIKDMEDEWGTESNMYRVRVLGDFPIAEADQFITLHDCEMAMECEPLILTPVVWSLDPARFGGDDTALCRRFGNSVLPFLLLRGQTDLMQVTGWLVAQYNETPPDCRPVKIFIDEVGLGGGVVDRAREVGLPVVGINSGWASSDKSKWFNLRAEMWDRMRMALRSGNFQLPRDDALIAECTSLKYKFTSSGQLQMEAKEDAKKRGVRSPNMSDALSYTFVYGNLDRLDPRDRQPWEKRIDRVKLDYDPMEVFQ